MIKYYHTNNVMDKKEISAKTTVKAIITGFVSYGIILGIICNFFIAFLTSIISNIPKSNSSTLYTIISIVISIFIYFIVRLLCKLSTFDVFKKCKTNPQNYKSIIKYLNIFFILCIIFSMVAFLTLLHLDLKLQKKTIQYEVLREGKVFSEEHVKNIENKMLEDYSKAKTNMIISTMILEIGLIISLLSLLSYQRKMITRFNEFDIQNENTNNVEVLK